MEQLPSPCVQQHTAPDSTPPAPEKVPVSLIDSLLDSDTSSEEEAKEGEAEELIRKVRQEVLTYFGEKPIPKGENPLEWWKLNEAKYPFFVKISKVLPLYTKHFHTSRAAVFCSRKYSL